MINKRPLHLFSLLFVLALVACQSFVKPANIDQRLMYAQAQVGAAYKTVADLRKREALSKADGQLAIAEIDKADQAIKLSRTALAQGDISTAEGKLNIALTALIAIESSLKAKK